MSLEQSPMSSADQLLDTDLSELTAGLKKSPVFAGQIADLIVIGTPQQKFTSFMNLVGNDEMRPETRYGLWELYCKVHALWEDAQALLADLPETRRNAMARELIRALLKGQIELEGMTGEDFEAELRQLL